MKKAKLPAAASATAAAAAQWPRWAGALFVLLVLGAAFQLYSPAAQGPFLFDDLRMIYSQKETLAGTQWHEYLRGVRPLLTALFWWEGRAWGENTGPYHSLNVLLHALNALLVWLVARQLLRRAGYEGTGGVEAPAMVAALFFLAHPLQTESVAYIASQSETLSVLCAYGAMLVFFRDKGAGLGWGAALGVLVLFVAGAGFKEHAAVLPAALLVADVWFRRGGVGETLKRNIRFYGLLAAGTAAAAAIVARVLFSDITAGFGTKGVTPPQYLLTQGRVIWAYLRMLVLPLGQNLDHQYPMAQGFDLPGFAGLLALAAVTGAAWIWRKRFRLASFGWLVFLILIAPTSSLVPIADAMAERRLYLPFIGLALMAAEGLARWRPAHAFQAAVVLVLLLLGGVSYARNQAYGSAIAMWEDSTAKNPANGRAHFNLGYAYYLDGRCGAATAAYERSAQLRAVDYDLLVDWALALDCDGKPEEALGKLDQATRRERNAHAWSLKGMVHGKQGHAEAALAALAEAEKIDPQYAMTYVYRGNVLVQAGRAAAALAPFQRALELAPDNPAAQAGLQAARQALAGGAR